MQYFQYIFTRFCYSVLNCAITIDMFDQVRWYGRTSINDNLRLLQLPLILFVGKVFIFIDASQFNAIS